MRVGVLLVIGVVGAGCRPDLEAACSIHTTGRSLGHGEPCPSAEELARNCGKYCGDVPRVSSDGAIDGYDRPGTNCWCGYASECTPPCEPKSLSCEFEVCYL